MARVNRKRPGGLPGWLIGAWLGLFAANLLVGNASTTVWDQDEAAYAGFASDMLVHHHWIVPHFPYTQPHRKVPLTFWMIAGSFALFGINEFALRLPSVLATATTVACIWWGSRFLVGRRTAQLAAMILSSCLFVLDLGKLALTDSVLLCCTTVAALALLRGVVRPSWKATVVLWFAVAAGLLAKGPPILIVVGGMFVFLLVLHPRRRNLISLHPWLGLPLALAPLAVWIMLAWQEDARYVLFLAYWYVVRRIGGSTFGQNGPPGTHFVSFFALLMPWTAYLLSALVMLWTGIRKRRSFAVLIASWLFGGWLLWELPSSKLPTYALGAFPAFALLLARQVRATLSGRLNWDAHRSLRVGFRIMVGIGVVAAVALTVGDLWLGSGWLRIVGVAPGVAGVLIALQALRQQHRARARSAFITLCCGYLVVNLLTWLTVVPAIQPTSSVHRRVAQLIAERCRPGTTVAVGWGVSAPSLPFYVERAGLRFRELSRDEEGPPPPLKIDAALLYGFRFQELAEQVRSQSGRDESNAEVYAKRLERVRVLAATNEPFAFVLDEAQYAALRDHLGAAQIVRVDGWLTERFRPVQYIIAITPTAARKPATSP